jgi:DNA-binding XRE family transcriptional regulator
MAEIQISLAAARVNAGLTQEDVAKKMKVTKQTIVNWEKGRTELKPAEFYMMCDMYGIPKDYIFLPRI